MIAAKNILILTYWSYSDALVQTYTLPYVRIIAQQLPKGSKVFLVTLDKTTSKNQNTDSLIQHISIPYQPFGMRSAFIWLRHLLRLNRLIRKENISTIHAWCTPAGMIGHILSKFSSRELIIDSFEPHAEAMVENGTWQKDSFAFKILFRYEKLQAKRAKHLIVCTNSMKDYASEKYGHAGTNFFVKPACVDLEQFSAKNKKQASLLKELDLENKIVCVYAGKFGGIYLDKEIFSFFKSAQDHWGEQFRLLILSQHTQEEINAFAQMAGLNLSQLILRFVPHDQVANYIGLADFAVTPVKPVPTKKHCSPIKDGEYWALGLPVMITKNISEDSDIIEKYKIGSILENFTEADNVKSVKEIDEILKTHSKEELFEKIRKVAIEHRNFKTAETIYRSIYAQK